MIVQTVQMDGHPQISLNIHIPYLTNNSPFYKVEQETLLHYKNHLFSTLWMENYL